MKPYIEFLETILFAFLLIILWYIFKIGTNAECLIVFILSTMLFEIARLRADVNISKARLRYIRRLKKRLRYLKK